MSFLDTKPADLSPHANETTVADHERLRVVDPGRQRRILENLLRDDTPIVIGPVGGEQPFTASLWSLDIPAGRMYFKVPSNESISPLVLSHTSLWAAAYDGSSKVQFDVHGRTLELQGGQTMLRARLPSAMYVLPRRSALRARKAQGLEPVVQFEHPADGATLRLPAQDISLGGLAVMLSPQVRPLHPGTLLRGVEIDLEPGERTNFFVADLQVQSATAAAPATPESPVRVGLAWVGLPPTAQAALELWTKNAQRRRQVVTLSLDL